MPAAFAGVQARLVFLIAGCLCRWLRRRRCARTICSSPALLQVPYGTIATLPNRPRASYRSISAAASLSENVAAITGLIPPVARRAS